LIACYCIAVFNWWCGGQRQPSTVARLIYWVGDWLTDWLTDWLIDWLADWLIEPTCEAATNQMGNHSNRVSRSQSLRPGLFLTCPGLPALSLAICHRVQSMVFVLRPSAPSPPSQPPGNRKPSPLTHRRSHICLALSVALIALSHLLPWACVGVGQLEPRPKKKNKILSAVLIDTRRSERGKKRNTLVKENEIYEVIYNIQISTNVHWKCIDSYNFLFNYIISNFVYFVGIWYVIYRIFFF